MKENRNEFLDITYHTPSTLEKMGGIWLLRMGKSIAKPNYSVGPRFTDYYSLHFILEGEMILEQSNRHYHMQAGDVFCIFPHISHRYYIADPKQKLRFLWISVKGNQMEGILERIEITSQHPYQSQMFDLSLINAFEKIIDAITNVTYLNELVISKLLYDFFQELIKQNQKSSTKNELEFMINESLQYMDTHYSEGIRVQDVVYHLEGVERSRFTKIFKKHTGKTPQEYLQGLRMRKADQMLRETSYQVTDIALSLGYPDLYAFSRAFKQFYGQSPSHYRKTQQF